MTAERIFIGGLNDGARMIVHDLPIIKLPVPPRVVKGGFIDVETYRKEQLATADCVFAFYVSLDLSTSDAIERLLAHYNPNTAQPVRDILRKAIDA